MGGMNEFAAQGHMEDAIRHEATMAAVREVAEANIGEGGEARGEGKYSLETTPSGIRYVDVNIDQHLFDGLTMEEMQNVAKQEILKRFKNKVIGSNYTAYVSRDSAKHYAFPANRRMDQTQKQAKMRAATELDNIIEASTFLRNEADDGRHPRATGGFDKLETILKVGNRVYSAEISVMVTDRGRLFYDLTKFKRV